MRVEQPPAQVSRDDAALVEQATASAFDQAATGWRAEPARRQVWIKLAATPGQAAEVTLSSP